MSQILGCIVGFILFLATLISYYWLPRNCKKCGKRVRPNTEYYEPFALSMEYPVEHIHYNLHATCAD